jgi:hypothetical protein
VRRPALTIADTRRLRVGTHVEPRDVPFAHVGDGVTVADTANSDRAARAAVSRSGGRFQPIRVAANAR